MTAMNWERKDNKQLKYKVGDKLMGYYEGDLSALVAGNVIEIHQSSSHLSDNDYRLQLDSRTVMVVEVEEGKKETIDTWWIDEKEAVPFDEERFARALILNQRRQTAMKMARESYIEMRKELYPEKYAKKGEDKENN